MKTRTMQWFSVAAVWAVTATVGMAQTPPTEAVTRLDYPYLTGTNTSWAPAWRGADGTTFQYWGFDTVNFEDPNYQYGPVVNTADYFTNKSGGDFTAPQATATAETSGTGWNYMTAAGGGWNGDFSTNCQPYLVDNVEGWYNTGLWDLGYNGSGTIVIYVTNPPSTGTREIWVQWNEGVVSGVITTNIVTVAGGTLQGTGYEMRVVEAPADTLSYSWNVMRTRWNVPASTGVDQITITSASGSGTLSLVESVLVETMETPAVTHNPPQMNDITAAVQQDKLLVLLTDKLLSRAYDPDGALMAITAVSPPTNALNGASTVLNSGNIAYTPAPLFVGQDLFTFTITDGNSMTKVVNALITVTSSNAPSLNIVARSGTAGNYSVSLVGVPGTVYTVEAASSVEGPWTKVGNTPTVPTTGRVTYTDSYVGSLRFYRTVYPSY